MKKLVGALLVLAAVVVSIHNNLLSTDSLADQLRSSRTPTTVQCSLLHHWCTAVRPAALAHGPDTRAAASSRSRWRPFPGTEARTGRNRRRARSFPAIRRRSVCRG